VSSAQNSVFQLLLFLAVKPPKLLIIYTQSSETHIKVVEELAQYLRKFCHVDALLDKLDISKTKTQVPK
jgi:hypothetical protein